MVGEHRSRLPRAVRPRGDLRPRPDARASIEVARPPPRTVVDTVRRAVAARGLARRPDALPALPRRPLLPCGLPAAGGAGTTRLRARRDGRRAPARAGASGRARRPLGGLPRRTVTR